MEEIYICGKSYFLKNKDKLIQNGITHVVTLSTLMHPY